MAKDVYLENVEKTIKNQIKWQSLDEIEIQLFLKEVISLCNKLYGQSERKWLKSPKTRHG